LYRFITIKKEPQIYLKITIKLKVYTFGFKFIKRVYIMTSGGFLFNNIIFGPVNSRRFGISLGINLLPRNNKLCNYNCIYCECGLTPEDSIIAEKRLPDKDEVKRDLEVSLIGMLNNNLPIDSITFAGNGEPTLHPQFLDIVDEVIELRNKYYPSTKVSVLTNATTAGNPNIMSALMKVDQNVMKLDVGTEEMYTLINRCRWDIKLSDIVSYLIRFNGKLIVQSLFLRGEVNGKIIDNTLSSEIEKWLIHLDKIRPAKVMIYSIARATPLAGIRQVPLQELQLIAEKVDNIGIKAEVYI